MKKDKNARKETKAAKVATAGQRKQAKESMALPITLHGYFNFRQ